MPPPGEEKLPKDFGKYRLRKRIATGGMAEIFLAELREAPGPVVVKRILPHLAESAEFVSMFLDEARIAARLQHPNIVSIEDVGQVNGAYYIAMEYIHGEDVRRIYNQAYKLQRSLPLSHSIRVVAEAALGLEFAHTLEDGLTHKKVGVVHRDVSPQNILVTYQGGVKVVDFGIAKAANKVNQTRAGVLKGKYSYMSPEQALGDPIDHRTDIFALGIILYETTTGTRLFKRPNELATLQAVIKCDVVPPSDALPGYPVELEEIVLKALEKEPRDRYQTATALSADLYRFLKSSRLYVEPDAIADFMADLFADRLAEERASGQLVLPKEHEVRAEMEAPVEDADPPTDESRNTHEVSSAIVKAVAAPGVAAGGLTEDTRLSSRALATFADDNPPGFGFADYGGGTDSGEADAADGTVPEEDFEDLAAKLRASRPPPPPAPKASSDQAPTVVNASAYRNPVMPMPEKAERVSGVHESTEYVRASMPKKNGAVASLPPSKRPSMSIPPAALEPKVQRSDARVEVPGRRVAIGAVVLFVLGLVVAIGAGLMWPRGGAQAPAGSGEVTVHTEPGALVALGDRALGSAGADGTAGPFALPAGPQTVRVTIAPGSTRERLIHVRAGGMHEIEVRARQGFVRLLVAPWARVTVDGKDSGITPLPPLALAEGQHVVVLDNPDLRRKHIADVVVEAGKTVELKIDLMATGLEY